MGCGASTKVVEGVEVCPPDDSAPFINRTKANVPAYVEPVNIPPSDHANNGGGAGTGVGGGRGAAAALAPQSFAYDETSDDPDAIAIAEAASAAAAAADADQRQLTDFEVDTFDARLTGLLHARDPERSGFVLVSQMEQALQEIGRSHVLALHADEVHRLMGEVSQNYHGLIFYDAKLVRKIATAAAIITSPKVRQWMDQVRPLDKVSLLRQLSYTEFELLLRSTLAEARTWKEKIEGGTGPHGSLSRYNVVRLLRHAALALTDREINALTASLDCDADGNVSFEAALASSWMMLMLCEYYCLAENQRSVQQWATLLDERFFAEDVGKKGTLAHKTARHVLRTAGISVTRQQTLYLLSETAETEDGQFDYKVACSSLAARLSDLLEPSSAIERYHVAATRVSGSSSMGVSARQVVHGEDALRFQASLLHWFSSLSISTIAEDGSELFLVPRASIKEGLHTLEGWTPHEARAVLSLVDEAQLPLDELERLIPLFFSLLRYMALHALS